MSLSLNYSVANLIDTLEETLDQISPDLLDLSETYTNTRRRLPDPATTSDLDSKFNEANNKLFAISSTIQDAKQALLQLQKAYNETLKNA